MNWVELPPVAFLAVALAVYPVILILRGSPGLIAMALVVGALAAVFALPGGREMISDAQQLPSRLQRAECVGQAIARGAPIERTASARSPKCSFGGRGLPPSSDPALAQRLLSSARSSLNP